MFPVEKQINELVTLILLTLLVKLVVEVPTMARLVTLPLKTDWTELMKLDFPEPTGPRSRTLV